MLNAVSAKVPEAGGLAAHVGDRPRLGAIALGLWTFALWMLFQGYGGLIQDAQLYSMQALAHQHPDLFGSDLYLRFGSQDRYTVFSPIYAAAIGLLGLEPAALALTLVSQAGFFIAAAFLARRLLPPAQALIGVALLAVMPSEYGPGALFQFIEGVVTPRLAAETLVIAGLAAYLSQRMRWATLFMLAGLLIHPLMAMAGVALLVTLQFALPRPRMALAAAGAAALLLGAVAFAAPSLRVDPLWHDIIVDRMPQVFLGEWSMESWARAPVPLIALTVAALLVPNPYVRRISLAAIVVGIGGVALTLIGADVLRIALVTQAQPWRWLWIANVLAILLLPLIAASCWQRGLAGRATFALLFSLWLLRNDAYCVALMPLVIAVAYYTSRATIAVRTGRAMLLGALLVLALALFSNISMSVLYAGKLYPALGQNELIDKIRGAGADGLLPLALFAAALWCLARARNNVPRITIGALAAIACLALLPMKLDEWLSTRYSAATQREFAQWQQQIPVGAEVLWVDTPLDGRVLLQRPLYLATDQSASALFSRPAAMELLRRDTLLAQYFPEGHFLMTDRIRTDTSRAVTLARACELPEISFIATHTDLHAPELLRASDATGPTRGLKLYRCDRPAT